MRLIVSEGWEHIFKGTKQKIVRFCLDSDLLDEGTTAFKSFGIKDSRGWRMAFRAEAEDVLDSLVNGNPDFLEHPEHYGALLVNKEPVWENDVRGRSIL